MKGKNQRWHREGSCPLNRSLLVHVPRVRSSQETHIPDRVITVHKTRTALCRLSHTHPVFPSKHTHSHTDTNIRHTPASQNKLCCFTLSLPFIHRQKQTLVKKQTVPGVQTASPFNERMPRGISWHQPNNQATAHVGKRVKSKLKIIKPMPQLKCDILLGQQNECDEHQVPMSESLSLHFWMSA